LQTAQNSQKSTTAAEHAESVGKDGNVTLRPVCRQHIAGWCPVVSYGRATRGQHRPSDTNQQHADDKPDATQVGFRLFQLALHPRRGAAT